MGTNDELRQAYLRLIAAVEANDAGALAETVDADVVDHAPSPVRRPASPG
jgi:hypothetical protein